MAVLLVIIINDKCSFYGNLQPGEMNFTSLGKSY